MAKTENHQRGHESTKRNHKVTELEKANSQRQQAEEALRDSEALNRAIVDTAVDAIITINAQGVIETFNPAAERIFGYRAEEVIGQKINILMPDPDRSRHDEYVANYLRTGVRKIIGIGREVVGQRKDGTTFPIELAVSEVNLSGQRIFAGIVRDITERKQAEERLRRQFMQMNLLNQITRAVADRQDLNSIFRVVLHRLERDLPIDCGGVFFLEKGTDTLRVVTCSPPDHPIISLLDPRQENRLTLEETGLRACAEGQMLSIPDVAQLDAPMFRVFVEHGLRSVVVVPLMVAEETFGLLIAARCAVAGFTATDGEFLQMLSEHVALAAHHAELYQDLQNAFENLHQTQQAAMQQERLRALGQMASGIVHDINNAISPISILTEVLLDEPELSEEAQQDLNTIRTAVNDIAQIIERMREFYRKRDANEELLPINLERLMQQVIDLTRPRWRDIPQEKGIVIEVRTEISPLRAQMRGIESELREALTNLIFNAVDAMPQGGIITLHARQERNDIIIEVRDEGVGMDTETRRRCLEPFYSTKGERGSGLGLAMVYGIVTERHDGRIEIDSEVERGTTVRLIFPLRVSSNIGNIGPDVNHAALKRLRILCIDDEPLLRESMKRMLEREGHVVTLADKGESGLEAFRAAQLEGVPFDVVITDLGMPYVDGRQVAQTVKQESPDTPVIMLTGWGNSQREGSAFEHLDTSRGSVDAILSKPPKVKQVLETLQRLTQSERSR